jgi:hypothetical protein
MSVKWGLFWGWESVGVGKLREWRVNMTEVLYTHCKKTE